MRWKSRGRRQVYGSPWVDVWIDDVELPGGRRIDHHVLTFPRDSVTAVVVDDRDRVLLLWRHRYITDAWGWEIPAGWAEPGEDLAVAAAREVEEETGHRAGHVTPLTSYRALSGISTMRFTSFLVTGACWVGDPVDQEESARVEWVSLEDIPRLARSEKISDGPSLTALSYYRGMYRT